MCCYISPNCDNPTFLRFLQGLKTIVLRSQKPLIIMGDFNAYSRSWGSKSTNHRGRLVDVWTAECNLVLLNDGAKPTFNRGTFIDLCFVSSTIASESLEWRVLDEETLSDHNYIFFSINKGDERVTFRTLPRFRKAKATDKLKIMEDIKDTSLESHSPSDIMMYATTICKSTLRRPRTNRKAVPWWNDEIAVARRLAIGAKRRKCRLAHPRKNTWQWSVIAACENNCAAR